MRTLLSLFFIFLTFNCSAGVTSWIDFSLENGHVKIPVSIAGINTHVIFDTGSQINVINKAFITKHNLTFNKGSKVKIKGLFGIEHKTSYRNVPIKFLNTEAKLSKVVEANLGYHTNGLLFGADFFKKFIIQLDYPNKKMRLANHGSINVAKFQNINIQKQKGTNMPIVKVGLSDDKYLWLLLDTGNTGGMFVKRMVAKKMGWLEARESQLSVSMGVNSTLETESFRVPQLQFGPFELENVLVTIPAEGSNSYLESQYEKTGSKIKGRRVQGIIGYDVLKHFLLTIDYKGGYAHIGLPEH